MAALKLAIKQRKRYLKWVAVGVADQSNNLAPHFRVVNLIETRQPIFTDMSLLHDPNYIHLFGENCLPIVPQSLRESCECINIDRVSIGVEVSVPSVRFIQVLAAVGDTEKAIDLDTYALNSMVGPVQFGDRASNDCVWDQELLC